VIASISPRGLVFPVLPFCRRLFPSPVLHTFFKFFTPSRPAELSTLLFFVVYHHFQSFWSLLPLFEPPIFFFFFPRLKYPPFALEFHLLMAVFLMDRPIVTFFPSFSFRIPSRRLVACFPTHLVVFFYILLTLSRSPFALDVQQTISSPVTDSVCFLNVPGFFLSAFFWRKHTTGISATGYPSYSGHIGEHPVTVFPPRYLSFVNLVP